jgi:putative acetyltransferase
LLLRVHVLPLVRRHGAQGPLPELRRRTRAAAAPAGGEARKVSRIDSARLQARGLQSRVKVRIRPEAESDHTAIREVNNAAFGRPDEGRLVDALRGHAKPFVSLVAEKDDAVVGHIAFTPVALDGFDGLLIGLAPMAVVPAAQRSGMGSMLVRAGLERCTALGAVAVVVVGHPEYYPRFGFVPAGRFGLSSEYDVPPEAFMALELRPGALRGASGTVRYHDAFRAL